jgi:hypothetical protein
MYFLRQRAEREYGGYGGGILDCLCTALSLIFAGQRRNYGDEGDAYTVERDVRRHLAALHVR